MEIKNNKEELPFSHYFERYRKADTAEILKRLEGTVQQVGDQLFVTLMSTVYSIKCPGFLLHQQNLFDPKPPLPVQTFLLRYLLEGKNIPWQGNWKTFREMPWGELYIQPYTGRVLTRAAFSFGTKLDKFRTASEKLESRQLPHGDAGYQFRFLGNYYMQLMVWEGDDEFPPNAQLLYSDNFEEGFAPEDRVVAGDILISAVKALF